MLAFTSFCFHYTMGREKINHFVVQVHCVVLQHRHTWRSCGQCSRRPGNLLQSPSRQRLARPYLKGTTQTHHPFSGFSKILSHFQDLGTITHKIGGLLIHLPQEQLFCRTGWQSILILNGLTLPLNGLTSARH